MITITRQREIPAAATPWAAVYGKLRQAAALMSGQRIEQVHIENAVATAVTYASEKCFQLDLLTIHLTEYAEVVTLPCQPRHVLLCAWKLGDVDHEPEAIPGGLWDVYGNEWRWLGSQADWPSVPVSVWLRVAYAPRTAEEEPGFCTVPIHNMIALARAELMYMLAFEDTKSRGKAAAEAERARLGAMASMPYMQLPPHVPVDNPESVSVVVATWGNLDLTFNDFS